MIKNKIIAFFVLIALFIVPVAAFADIYIPEDIPYVGDGWDYWIVTEYDGEYYLYFTKNPMVHNGGNVLYLDGGYREYKYDGNVWNYFYGYDYDASLNTDFDTVLASNHDIAYRDGSGFFFTPPRVSELYRTMKTMTSGTLLRTILAGLTPLVGLVILGISFRKAWGFLLSRLTH